MFTLIVNLEDYSKSGIEALEFRRRMHLKVSADTISHNSNFRPQITVCETVGREMGLFAKLQHAAITLKTDDFLPGELTEDHTSHAGLQVARDISQSRLLELVKARLDEEKARKAEREAEDNRKFLALKDQTIAALRARIGQLEEQLEATNKEEGEEEDSAA